MDQNGTPNEWVGFVEDRHRNLAKDAVLGGSALPGWMLKALLRWPLVSAIAAGAIAGALLMIDTPIDWSFVAAVFGVVFVEVLYTAVRLRRRVRAYVGRRLGT